MQESRVLAVVLCLCVLSVTASVYAQPSKLGVETRVNNPNANRQTHPDVAMHDDGHFVVVWQSGSGADGNAYGVFGRRLNAAGVVQAVEFQVNDYTSGSQSYPEVAMSASGAFVVVWYSLSPQDGSSFGVFAKRFNSSGTVLATEFQVNTYTTNSQSAPDVAMDDDGDFVIVWQGYGASDGGIFGRRFDSTGAALAAEFQVHTYNNVGAGQVEARVAAAGNGDFVVVWDSPGQDGSVAGIFGQRFDSTGTAQGVEFLVNTLTSGTQNIPALAMIDSGAFVVVWNGSYPLNNAGVLAQRFDATGAPVGVEFVVNLYTPGNQVFPVVAAASDGSFVMAYQSPHDGNSYGVFARSFDSAGVASSDFQVNTYTSTSQVLPAIAMASDGDFVIAWMSPQPADNGDVFIQRGGTPPVLAPGDIDGDSTIGPLTDGLLALRHMFGFTGATLIAGATGGNCSRCDAAAITAYLNGLGLTLDADDNGELGALTDGLLYLRFAFGFNGNTLINGATANDCNRCDAVDIVDYLESLM